ncbi:MAG: hypothetical protein II842_18035 [Butyrivibrio sp.]|nr:hypothetical protein [Butyrivibrio sp.]
MTTVIKATLSVVLHLIDTTTGKDINETIARFSSGNEVLRPLDKGNGNWLFINLGKEDFLMHVSVNGYDDADINITFETLDPRMPLLDVFLMPSEKNRVGGEVLKICGTLPELSAIEAIHLSRPICGFSSVLEKRGKYLMNLIPRSAGGRIELESMKYALLSETRERYEVFEVLEKETQTCVTIRSPMTSEHKVNELIYRIIYGRAGPEGDFSLKVRDDSSTLDYLIRFRTGDVDYFKTVDFHLQHGEIDLMEDAIKVESLPGKEEVNNE